jgi:hypothetical protein
MRLRQKDLPRGGTDVAGPAHGREVTQLSKFQGRQHDQKAGSGNDLGIIQNEKKPACCAQGALHFDLS